MVKFDTVAKMVEAMKRDEIPVYVSSPGPCSAALGITRQSLHALLHRGTLPAWSAPGIILVDFKAVELRVENKKRAERDANFEQRELL